MERSVLLCIHKAEEIGWICIKNEKMKHLNYAFNPVDLIDYKKWPKNISFILYALSKSWGGENGF